MSHDEVKARREQKKRELMALTVGVLEAVKSAGEDGIPSGHLYSVMMGHLSLDEFQFIVSTLVAMGMMTDEHHLLRAVAS